MDFFDYFQIASAASFLLIFLAKAAYLRLSRNINPIAVGRGKRGLARVMELIAMAGLVAWLFVVLSHALHLSFRVFPSVLSVLDARLIESFPVKCIGVVLVSLGVIIFALAFLSFGDSWRVGFDVKTPGALVTTGIFSVSRNPIYVFLNLWFTGTFLINGTLIFLIFAVLAVAILHWQIRQEESFLLKLYGRAYQNYYARTGRYLLW